MRVIYKLPKGTWIERKRRTPQWEIRRWDKCLTTKDAYYSEKEMYPSLDAPGIGFWYVDLLVRNEHWTLRMKPHSLIKSTRE